MPCLINQVVLSPYCYCSLCPNYVLIADKNTPQKTPPTQIPRFVAFLEQRKQEQKKPITPGNCSNSFLEKKQWPKR